MMYQNLISDDPNNGYGVYSIQPYSTTFTTWSSLAANNSNYDNVNAGSTTTYAYGSALDSDGNPYIMQSVGGGALTQVVPQTTSMSGAVLAALNAGAFLLTKSYTMNLNGNLVSTNASSSITVTQSCVQPYQYQITYTDSDKNQVSDTFQVPISTSTAPGASSNSYNNPPLDAVLQQSF